MTNLLSSILGRFWSFFLNMSIFVVFWLKSGLGGLRGLIEIVPKEQIFYKEDDSPAGPTLNLYDPKLFRPVVPDKFRSDIGECDTNYFKMSVMVGQVLMKN